MKCSSCDKVGHFAKVCISQEKGKNNRLESSTKQLEESHDNYGISEVMKKEKVDIFNQINMTINDAVKYFIIIQINEKSQELTRTPDICFYQ